MFFNFLTGNKKDLSVMCDNILDEMREHAKIVEIKNFKFFEQKGFDKLWEFEYKNRIITVKYPYPDKLTIKSAFHYTSEGFPVWFKLEAYPNQEEYWDDANRKNGYVCYIRMKRKGAFHDPNRAKKQIKSLIEFLERGKKPNPSLCHHGLDEYRAEPMEKYLKEDLPSALPEINKVKVTSKGSDEIKIMVWTDNRIGLLSSLKSDAWEIIIFNDSSFNEKEISIMYNDYRKIPYLDVPMIWHTLKYDVKLYVDIHKHIEYPHWIYEEMIYLLKKKNLFEEP